MHTVLVVVHAVAAVIAAAAGALALVRPRATAVYLGALAVSGVALGALAVFSPSRGMRVVDLGLLVLFGVVVGRAVLVARIPLPERRTSHRFLGGIGFGLISLADGFVIVAVLDLGAPWWAVAGAGVAVVVVGSTALGRLQRRRTGVGHLARRAAPVRGATPAG